MINKSFLRKIISSPLFWKIRHFIQPSFLQSYKSKPENKMIMDFIKSNTIKNEINLFFDFGCSCGSTLLGLANKNSKNICIGVDINKKSLEIAKSRFYQKNLINQCVFVNDLEDKKIKDLIESYQSIHLSIFDRVLYCISDRDFENLKFLITKSKYVFIDDFFLDIKKNKNFSYKHRDYFDIINKLNFSCVESFELNNVDDANPVAAIFKNNRTI